MKRHVGLLLGSLGIATLAVLLLVATADAPAAAAPATQQDIDWFSPSLAIDSSGMPHTSFWAKNVGNNLHFASWDDVEGEWIDAVADDSGSVGQYSSLAFDSIDRPHISYHDIDNGDLKYAMWNGSQWRSQTVDTGGAGGDVGTLYTSIVADGAGLPQISYYDSTNGALKFAKWDDGLGQWITDVVDSGDNVGAYSSMQLDSTGYPHISYSAEAERSLRYAYWDGSDWVTETVEVLAARPRYTSLALDAADQPRISYYDTVSESLRYAAWDGGVSQWITEVVDGGLPTADVGRYSSLALDLGGRPHISYHDTSNTAVMHAAWDGAQWLFDVVDDSVSPLGATSLALNASDEPRIAYGEGTNFDLRYAYWDPVQLAWVIQTMYTEEQAGVGYYNSLQLDTGLGAHISYYDKTNRDLKYARRLWDDGEWSWQTEIVDAQGRTGRHTSLQLDTNDAPSISYLDSTNSQLQYATIGVSGWELAPVPNALGMGPYSAQVFDSLGYPHISSYGSAGGDLTYAYWDGSQWNSVVVDEAGDTGWSTSITLDDGGMPHISYLDRTANSLRYATLSGTVWISETVAAVGTGPNAHRNGTSIGLDDAGYPRIAYHNSTEEKLQCATYDGTNWSTEVVDDSTVAGLRPSLQMGGDGLPRIGYYDAVHNDLKYASWNGSQWLTETVDSLANAGLYLSLALEPDSPYHPHLSYMEATLGVLKYAYWDGDEWLIEVADNPHADRVKILAMESNEPVEVGSKVQFSATVTGTAPIAYTWDFGGAGMPGGNDTNPTFRYDEAGTFTVTLEVENQYPSTDADAVVVRVVEEVLPVHITALESDSPVALGTAMHFTATVTGTEPITYTWDFGGAGSQGGTDTNPTFLYNDPGPYTVVLTVENDYPSTDDKTMVVRVEPVLRLFLPLVTRQAQ